LKNILWLYLLSYERYPVVCFDKCPCFLLGDVVEVLVMQKIAKENYASSKHDSCCTLAAIEPLAGKRFAHVRQQRRAKEFAPFMQELCALYPNTKRVKIVLDNLNAHVNSSFCEEFDAGTAALLTQEIKLRYTLKVLLG
jgi:hypothetical protein